MTTTNDDFLGKALARYGTLPGGLLPLLHAMQDELGYIPAEATARIAHNFNLSRAEVHGVVTYYHHFRQTPPPRHTLALCRAEACQARGGRQLAQTAEQCLQERPGWALESVYCLGLCANGPAALLDEQLYAAITPEKLNRLIVEAEATA